MGGRRLTGRLVIVTLDARGEERTVALARALAAEGAGVIVVADDGDRGGRLATLLRDEGAPRVAVFCSGTDPAADLDALVELVAEVGPRP